jgi:hypothetical protein
MEVFFGQLNYFTDSGLHLSFIVVEYLDIAGRNNVNNFLRCNNGIFAFHRLQQLPGFIFLGFIGIF